MEIAHLLNIAESDDDEQTKLDRLQEVYAILITRRYGFVQHLFWDEIDPLGYDASRKNKLKSRACVALI